MAETIKIGGELESTATGNVVAAASAIKDKVKNKYQSEINIETDASLANRYTKDETYSKTELNNMITTPNQQYVSVTANSQTTAATDVLPATGAANTIYRVGNWDGSQFDASVYSEYAWNGNSYVHINTKTQAGEVFDISVYHATGGKLAKYADLTVALDSNNGGGVPQSLQKGGISVKFVRSSDNKYVQYRLRTEDFSINVADWCNNAILVAEEQKKYLKKSTWEKSGHPITTVTSKSITNTGIIQTASYTSSVVIYSQNPFKKGDIIHISGEAASDKAIKVGFSFTNPILLEDLIGLQLFSTDLGFVYYTGKKHDYDIIVPEDNSYIFIGWSNIDWLSRTWDIYIDEDAQYINNYKEFVVEKSEYNSFTTGKFYNLSEGIGVVPTLQSATALMYLIKPVKNGDIVHIKCRGYGNGFPYALCDTNVVPYLIQKELNQTNGTTELIKKDGYIIINNRNTFDSPSLIVESNKVPSMEKDIQEINEKINGSFNENALRSLLHKQLIYAADSKGSIFGDNSAEHFMSCKKRCAYPRMQKADFRLTTDGKLYAHHDPSFIYEGQTFIFSNHTLQECYDAYKPQKYGEFVHPCDLERFIIICKRDGLLPLITFRNENYDGTAQEIARVLKKYNMETSAIINSYPYNKKTLQAVRKVLPYTYIRCTTGEDTFFTESQMEEIASYGNVIIYFWMSKSVFESDLTKVQWVKDNNILWWGSSSIGDYNLEKYGSVVKYYSIAPISQEYHISISIVNGTINNIPSVAYRSSPEWSADFELSQDSKELYISNIRANNDSEISDRIPNSWIAEFPSKVECDKNVVCLIDKTNYRFIIQNDNGIQDGIYNIVITI